MKLTAFLSIINILQVIIFTLLSDADLRIRVNQIMRLLYLVNKN